MAIYIISATPDLGQAGLFIQFSEPFNQDLELYRKSNYAFRTRFGVDVAIYAKEIFVSLWYPNTVYLDLQDAMLDGGNYELSISGVSAVSDGIRIEDGPGPTSAIFVGDGEPMKSFEIRRRVPPWLNTRWNSCLHAVLCATGEILDNLAGRDEASAIHEVAKALSLRTATDKDLGVIGANFGVSRPDFVLSNDDLFRKLIPILSTKRKAVVNIFYEVLEAVFGPAITAGWKVFEIHNNQIIIELPAELFFGLHPGSLASATYLHDGPIDSISTSVGLNFLADTTQSWSVNQWVGAILVDNTSAEFVISSNTATILTVSGTPAAGAYNILIPATTTYPGDYFCADATVDGSTVGGNIIILFQQTILDDIFNRLKASGIEILVVLRE